QAKSWTARSDPARAREERAANLGAMRARSPSNPCETEQGHPQQAERRRLRHHRRTRHREVVDREVEGPAATCDLHRHDVARTDTATMSRGLLKKPKKAVGPAAGIAFRLEKRAPDWKTIVTRKTEPMSRLVSKPSARAG